MPKVREKTTHGLPLFDRLLDVASPRGFSRAVSNIHRSLHIDDRLFGYIRRARTLQNIVNLSLGGDMLVDECPVLAIWTPYLRDLLDHADDYVKDMHLDPAQEAEFRRDTGGDPLQRIAKKAHPMEALLWSRVSEKDRKGYLRFLMLQAQILLAHVSVLDVAHEADARTELPSKEHKSDVFKSLYEPCHFAERFANPDWSAALHQLPLLFNPSRYRRELDGLRDRLLNISNPEISKRYKAIDESLAGISTLIARGVHKSEYQKRAFKGRESEAITLESENVASDATSGRIPGDDATLVTRTKGTPAEKDQIEKSDEAPEDHLPRREFILTRGGETSASFYAAALDRANQLLPGRYTEPRPGEFIRLLHEISSKSSIDSKELIAWVETIFWLSCSPEQATELRVAYPTTPIEDRYDFVLRLSEELDGEEAFAPRVRIRALEPPYKTVYEPIKGERRRALSFELPDRGNLSGRIRGLLRALMEKNQTEISPESIRRQPLKIFPKSPTEYIRALEEAASSAGLADRIDAYGLSELLFQRFVEAGDVVSATLLTCKPQRLASVRRWYFTPSIQHLMAIHARAHERIELELLAAGWSHSKVRTSAPLLDQGFSKFIGSRRCAEFRFIADTIQRLQGIVEESSAARSRTQKLEAFVNKHNAATLLAVWAIDLSVGMRGVEHPYLHASEYDSDTGMGCLDDKDSGQGQKTRAFRLCERALLIAKEYDRYLSKVGTLKGFDLPSSTRGLPCYFVAIVDKNLEPSTVTPKSIEQYFRTDFRFKPNWARRFVKTIALESRIPAIYTDNYCGHSYRGEQRWHTFASFDPVAYFDVMGTFIGDLLDKLGFRTLALETNVLKYLDGMR